jgi:hypothetical protein
MAGGEGIHVTSADLVRHAGNLDGITGALAAARQAGQATRLDAGAYGQLCQMVPALLDGLQHLIVDGIGTAADSVRDTAARVRTAAAGYDHADGRAAAKLDGIRGSGR